MFALSNTASQKAGQAHVSTSQRSNDDSINSESHGCATGHRPATVQSSPSLIADFDDSMSSRAILRLEGNLQLVYISGILCEATEHGRSRLPVDFETIATLARETDVHLPEDYEEWKMNDDCQRAADWMIVCLLTEGKSRVDGLFSTIPDFQRSSLTVTASARSPCMVGHGGQRNLLGVRCQNEWTSAKGIPYTRCFS